MIAKENYNFYNQSDIFNVKPKIDRKQFQTAITERIEAKNKKKALNITADNISPSRTFKHLKSTHTPTNKSRNIPIKTGNITQEYHPLQTQTTQPTINYKSKNFLKKEDDLSNVILDTSAEARKEFAKNLDRVHHDKVVLGTDRPSYTTTNSISQEYAKKQCKKARMLEPNKINPPFKPQKPVGKKQLIFTTNNTTDAKFNENENAISNKMNFHKSNIFNDPEKEKKNLILKPNNPKENKNNKPQVTPTRKRLVNDEACIPNVDWRYNRTDIIFNKSKTKMEFKTARERKLHDNKGAFPCKYDDYVPPVQQNEKRDKSVDDIKKEKYKHIGEEQRKPENFVIENIAMNDNFDMQTIKKVYRNNGLHIFGDRMDPMFMNGKVKGNAKFKVRKNNDDNLYEERIKKAEEKIEKEQGIKIIKKKEDDDSEKHIEKQSNIKTEPGKQKIDNEKDFRKKGNPKWMEIKIKNNAMKNQFKSVKKSSKD